MTEHDALATRVHDELSERAAGVHGAPFTLGDISGRARSIQRRRRAGVATALAAVIAIVVPLALLVGPGQERSQGVDPARPPSALPVPGEPVVISTRLGQAPEGPGPLVPYVRISDSTLVSVTGETALPFAYPQVVPSGDGYLAIVTGDVVPDTRSDQHVVRLDGRFRQVDDLGEGDRLVVSPDGSEVAWVQLSDRGATLVVATADGATPVRILLDAVSAEAVGFLPDGRVAMGFGDEMDVVDTFRAVSRDGARTPIAGFQFLSSASAATGLVAGQTDYRDDGTRCSGVGKAGGDLLWQRCDLALGELSPDGTAVIAFAPADNPSGNRGISILDAATGTPYVELVGQGGNAPTVDNAVWESDGSVLAVLSQGAQQAVVRIGRDGTYERVSPLIASSSMDTDLLLTTRARG